MGHIVYAFFWPIQGLIKALVSLEYQIDITDITIVSKYSFLLIKWVKLFPVNIKKSATTISKYSFLLIKWVEYFPHIPKFIPAHGPYNPFS